MYDEVIVEGNRPLQWKIALNFVRRAEIYKALLTFQPKPRDNVSIKIPAVRI